MHPAVDDDERRPNEWLINESLINESLILAMDPAAVDHDERRPLLQRERQRRRLRLLAALPAAGDS